MPQNAANAHLMYLTSKAEQAISIAIGRVKGATTVTQVVQWKSPSIPSYLRSVLKASASSRHLERTAEETAERLVLAQLSKLRGLNLDERKKLQATYQRGDWLMLRGNFPRLVHLVDRELAMMRHEEKESGDAPLKTSTRPRG